MAVKFSKRSNAVTSSSSVIKLKAISMQERKEIRISSYQYLLP